MNQCFSLVPASHYGLHSEVFADVIRSPGLDFPLLPLPHYVKGLASIAVTHNTDDNNFFTQLEFLIDGMDIDEEWCHTYLDDPALEFIRNRSTRSAKRARMGSHPKYEGNLTTYIHNELEREVVIRVVGRTMEDNGKSLFNFEHFAPGPLLPVVFTASSELKVIFILKACAAMFQRHAPPSRYFVRYGLSSVNNIL
jgi:hypothetical protein